MIGGKRDVNADTARRTTFFQYEKTIGKLFEGALMLYVATISYNVCIFPKYYSFYLLRIPLFYTYKGKTQDIKSKFNKKQYTGVWKVFCFISVFLTVYPISFILLLLQIILYSCNSPYLFQYNFCRHKTKIHITKTVKHYTV